MCSECGGTKWAEGKQQRAYNLVQVAAILLTATSGSCAAAALPAKKR